MDDGDCKAHYDILVVGGGPIGMSLAYALQQSTNFHIGLLEAKAKKGQKAVDGRSLALTYQNKKFFHKLGLWSDLASAAVPIQHIHVSDQGGFGMMRLAAQALNVPALGYVLPFAHVQNILEKAVTTSNIDVIQPAQVKAIRQISDGWQVTILTGQTEQTINTSLLIAADGGYSTIRQLLAISTRQWDYQQLAIVANIHLSRSHQQTAYERFVPSGAIAMLPLVDDKAALIWSASKDQAEQLLAMDDQAFLDNLQREFGYRLGKLRSIEKRQSYPLQMIYAQQTAIPGLVLVGNAAHTLHPIAAQGFNLGLYDSVLLTELITRVGDNKKKLFSTQLMQDYHDKNTKAHWRMIGFTDSIVRIFAHAFLPLTMARNIGLTAMEVLGPIKNQFAKFGMGLKI